jgi:serine protease Do
MAERLGLKEARGVVITAVEPRGAAAQAGLRPGDIVLEANRQPIKEAGDFKKMVDAVKPGENLLILVRRGESNMFLVLKPGSDPKG